MATYGDSHQNPVGALTRVDDMIRDTLKIQTLSLVELFIFLESRGIAEPVALCVLARMIQQGDVTYRGGRYVLTCAPAHAGGAA